MDVAQPYSFRKFFTYFLRLGSFGFGGPIVLTGYMHRDLVEEKKWITAEGYREGLALAQLAPGPLAAQLAIYLGWIRAGVWGATLVGFAFIIPSFLIVLVLSALYLKFGGLPWIQGIFYGIGSAVIAIMALSVYKLVRKSLGDDKLLWALTAANALITAWTESEIIWIFLLSGIAALFSKAPLRFGKGTAASFFLPSWLFTGLHGAETWKTLLKIALFFAKAGAVVFGSGLAIVPFLHGGVVQQFGWLTERQFIDAVAVAMITPGPVVITVAFIGYLVAGPLGSVAAALGVFLPCYLFVILPAPYYRRFAQNRQIKAFVDGVTASAIGAIAGAAIVLGRRAITDIPTAVIALAVLVTILRFKKLPEAGVVLAAGVVGLFLRSL